MNDCVSDKKDSQQSVPILFTILSNISRIAFSKNLTKYIQMVALHWEKYFQHIREKYNSIYKVQMPVVTPHVCRHTFCSNMAKSGMNPKTLQYLMGHSDISVMMNVYTHVGLNDAEEELRRMEEFQKAQAEVEKKNGIKPVSQKMFKAI